MRLGSRLAMEDGNALLEGISFAAVAFGLLLSSSLFLFDSQIKSLDMASIARNAMRDHLLNPNTSIDQFILLQQKGTSLEDQALEAKVNCSNKCQLGDEIDLEISWEGIRARSFGVIGE